MASRILLDLMTINIAEGIILYNVLVKGAGRFSSLGVELLCVSLGDA